MHTPSRLIPLLSILFLIGCGLPEAVPGGTDAGTPGQSSQNVSNGSTDAGSNPAGGAEEPDSGAPSPNPPDASADAGEPETQPEGNDAGAATTAQDAGAAVLVADAGSSDPALDCDDGFEADAGGCSNINDCAGVACGAGACVDLVNGFTCNCLSGYQDNDNDNNCEAACDSTSCNAYATCDDTSGTIACDCIPGAESSGGTCAPILCGENEYVSGNACSPCGSNTYNTAGDDATGSNTSCDAECIEDNHCGTGQECDENNACITPPCASHQECIDVWAGTPSASSDYACSNGDCVGLPNGKCYIDTHCENDIGTPYCDGDNSTLGDCRACTEHEHCIYDASGQLINGNGACLGNFCASMASGSCYVDEHCSDETMATGRVCLLNLASNAAGQCKQCIRNQDCIDLYGAPPPGNTYVCESNNVCVGQNLIRD